MLLTLITLARVSAPLQVRLQPEKFTVITEVLFFMALQRTAKKIIHSDAVTANQAKKMRKKKIVTASNGLLSTPLSPIWQNSRDKCCNVLFLEIPYKNKKI